MEHRVRQTRSLVARRTVGLTLVAMTVLLGAAGGSTTRDRDRGDGDNAEAFVGPASQLDATVEEHESPEDVEPVCAWQPGFSISDLDGPVNAIIEYDDGSGPAVYVGGEFTSADDLVVHHIARWDGTSWSALAGMSDTGTDLPVLALAVYDNGSGEALYAAGRIRTAGGLGVDRIAKWDGSEWSAIGGPSGSSGEIAINALEVYDDGTGPALYAGGRFTAAGGAMVNSIARWDGITWSALSGPAGGGVNGDVYALATWDNGAGAALYVGGVFDRAGSGLTVNGIARWDGTAWSALSGPSGVGVYGGGVLALAAFDDGGDEALFAAGWFVDAGGVTVNCIARWDGTAWSALSGPAGTGLGGSYWNQPRATALEVFPQGEGARLYVAGDFGTAGGLRAIDLAVWDGTQWSEVPGASVDDPVPVFEDIRALTAVHRQQQPALWVGGSNRSFGDLPVDRVARWDGSSWSAVSPHVGRGVNDMVFALAVDPQATAPSLVAGGMFTTAAGQVVNRVAAWNGTDWSGFYGPLDMGISWSSVGAFAWYGADDARAMYAGGDIWWAGGIYAPTVVKWSDTGWSAVANPEDPLGPSSVTSLAVFDDGTGPALYAAGRYQATAETWFEMVRWDGTRWSGVPGTSNDLMSGSVNALVVFDDGLGPSLYAGGSFLSVDGLPVDRIARWDGSQWWPLGSYWLPGLDDEVRALAVVDDWATPQLIAGGSFTTAGGEVVNHVARWDGSNWFAIADSGGVGVDGTVTTLQAADDGSGPALFVGGWFTHAAGQLVNRIAKWDGTAWSALEGPHGIGVDDAPHALAEFDAGSGPALYVGGRFTTAGGVPSSRIAAWCCDASAPIPPASFSSPSHAVGEYSSMNVVELVWSGALDIGCAGMAGFSVAFDDQPATLPDTAVEVTAAGDPHHFSSGPLADGDSIWAHLRSCDDNGNCSAAAHLGPFRIDATPPGAVSGLTSSSHSIGIPTADATLDLTWTDALDATSGVAGYGVEISTSPSWSCDRVQDTTATSFTTPPLDDGAWYTHVCAVDVAGNWGGVATAGPFVVDTTAPAVVAVGSEGGTADGVLSSDESVLAAVTQLWIGFSEPIDPVAVDRGIADPSHYRLVDRGPDGVLSTATCDGLPIGDDQDVALAGAWAWTGDDTVSIQIDRNSGLATGRYALVVCDIEDVPGNAMAAPWIRPFAVSADNLLHNPSFDFAGAWDTTSPSAQDIRFLGQDASSETSGTVVVDPLEGANELFELTQCLDVVEGTPYALGGIALVDSPLVTAPTLKAVVRFYRDPGCFDPLDTSEAVLAVGTTQWHWTPRLLLGARAPEGALSARVGFVVKGGTANHFSVYLDEAAFFVDVLFVDSFETGDPGWWTSTNP